MNRAAGNDRRRYVAGWVTLVTVVMLAASAGPALVSQHWPSAAAAAPAQAQVPPGGFTAAAASAIRKLNQRYSSVYTRTHSWQVASALNAMIDFMRVSGSRAFLGEVSSTFLAHVYTDKFGNYFYDDKGWWVLVWAKAYGLTGNRAYLAEAESIFARMTGGWNSTCGGGLQWHLRVPYKNAITNEEFLQDAVLLHDLTPGDTTYAGWALREWNWFSHTGLLPRSHLVVDGLSANCAPMLNSPTWTYNQGVLIGALVGLAAMTGRTSLLKTAEQVAHAVMDSPRLSPHGILRESCTPSCDRNGPLFKGIFAANLKLLYDRVGGADYQAFLQRNAIAMWNRDRNGSVYGLSWSGPFEFPSMPAQSAAVDMLNTQIG